MCCWTSRLVHLKTDHVTSKFYLNICVQYIYKGNEIAMLESHVYLHYTWVREKGAVVRICKRGGDPVIGYNVVGPKIIMSSEMIETHKDKPHDHHMCHLKNNVLTD